VHTSRDELRAARLSIGGQPEGVARNQIVLPRGLPIGRSRRPPAGESQVIVSFRATGLDRLPAESVAVIINV
jgi:hypothetical protein